MLQDFESNMFTKPEANNQLATVIPDESSLVQNSNSILVNGLSRLGNGVLRIGETSVMVAEVSPINEALRLSAGAAAIRSGMSPELVAGVYGGSTLAIESAAGVVAARWLTSERSIRTVGWINEKLEDRGISPQAKFNKTTKAGISFFGGTAVSSAVQFREQPSMDKPELRKYGLKVSALLAGACALQGYGVAKGIDTPSPATVGVALVSVGSIFGLAGWGNRRLNREQASQGIDSRMVRKQAKEKRKLDRTQRKQEKQNRRHEK